MVSSTAPGPGRSEEPDNGRRSRGFVDYERVAPLYRRGRFLPCDVLDRWGQAVRPHLPSGASLVVDVGAGTGVFAAAWPSWIRTRVVAVEAAAAMVRAATLGHPAVSFVQAVAEHLPIRESRADVVWLSAALHHFADVNRAIGEFRRVLRPGGRVLVRTYVPGRTEVSWAEEFPGRAKWVRRFHDEAELLDMFGAGGFGLIQATEVLEWTETYAASADWASMMRHADSMLTALSDEEITEGLATLRSQPDRVGRLELSLLVFEATIDGEDEAGDPTAVASGVEAPSERGRR